MTAAIYARRAGKSVLLIEKESVGGQITYSPRVENYPGLKGLSGMEFANGLYEQTRALGAEFGFGDVSAVSVDENGLKLIKAGSKTYTAKSLIIAVGVRHRRLGLPREDELAGAGVSYCAVCDGAFYKNMTVAVVGGGNTALSDALFLSASSKKIYLIHRRDTFRGERNTVELLSRRENAEFILDTVITGLIGDSALSGIRLRTLKTGEERLLAVDGLFAAIGQEAVNAPFGALVGLDENGFITASENCLTSHPGIFAAGDCRAKAVRQLTTAAADGSVAALEACKYVDLNFEL